ncbi:hypothetical protein E4T44_04323 [Aureobasidium sp. EXF-8845]|nr:hypothetical protein E4T44_04323 [Aureobasidium sp. EXF-8845]KAI4852430.1 hypothetical protein E4T45_04709 [Aureobasidium sp. EXF-8846]
MSTPTVKTEPGSSNPTTTPTVSNTKPLSIPWKVPPPSCFQTIVSVEVGTQKKAFLIHKDLLIFYSDYFRAAFNGSFSEATERKISLSDERVDVFSVVNQFVYTRQLSHQLDSDLQWEVLFRTWLFGNKYLMPSLQNKVMSVLFAKNKKTNVVPTLWLKLTYDNTLPGSPLRSFIVDFTAYKLDITIPEFGKLWPHEALIDLLKVVGAKSKEDIGSYTLPEANNRKCYYHIHADGEDCDTKA